MNAWYICPNCPGIGALKEHLTTFFIDRDVDVEELSFNQWKTVDGTELITQITTIDHYKTIICESIDKLTAHSYSQMPGSISQTQKRNFDKLLRI